MEMQGPKMMKAAILKKGKAEEFILIDAKNSIKPL